MSKKIFLRDGKCAFYILNLHHRMAYLYGSYLDHIFSLPVREFHKDKASVFCILIFYPGPSSNVL